MQATSTVGFTNALGTVSRTTGTADNMTAGCTANCGNANKNWVDAFIQITPQNAANAVGTNHVLTITVNAIGGGVLAAARRRRASSTRRARPAASSAPRRCNYTGGAATATCTVTITSAVAGTTTVQATSTIGFGNAVGTVSRTTGTADNVTAGCSSDCGNAAKNWVDAFIQITPQNATNAVGQQPRADDHGQRDRRRRPRGRNGDGEHPHAAEHDRQLRRLAHLQLRGRRGDGELHGHDHLRGRRHRRRCRRPRRSASATRSGPSPADRVGRQRHRRLHGELRQRQQELGRCVHPDHAAERLERGRHDHVLTITVNATNGGVLAAGTATASILKPPSTTGSFVGSPSCNYAGGAATASCTVTITSAVGGLTQVQATSTVGFTNAAGTVTRTTGTADNMTAGCTANCGTRTRTGWMRSSRSRRRTRPTRSAPLMC